MKELELILPGEGPRRKIEVPVRLEGLRIAARADEASHLVAVDYPVKAGYRVGDEAVGAVLRDALGIDDLKERLARIEGFANMHRTLRGPR